MIKHAQGRMTAKIDDAYKSDYPTLLVCGDEIVANAMQLIFTSGRGRKDGRERAEKNLANARRLAAAWNVCDGIDTDTLETAPGYKAAIDGFHEQRAEVMRLRAQVAELTSKACTAVFAVERCVPYEFTEICDISRTKEEAEAFLEELLSEDADTDSSQYSIEEYQLDAVAGVAPELDPS